MQETTQTTCRLCGKTLDDKDFQFQNEKSTTLYCTRCWGNPTYDTVPGENTESTKLEDEPRLTLILASFALAPFSVLLAAVFFMLKKKRAALFSIIAAIAGSALAILFRSIRG